MKMVYLFIYLFIYLFTLSLTVKVKKLEGARGHGQTRNAK
jgi:hypothetical protein